MRGHAGEPLIGGSRACYRTRMSAKDSLMLSQMCREEVQSGNLSSIYGIDIHKSVTAGELLTM